MAIAASVGDSGLGERMKYLLFGGGGVLGTGFRDVLPAEAVHRVSPRWTDAQATQELVCSAVRGLEAVSDDITIIWAAGVGRVGASAHNMSAEAEALAVLAAALLSLPPNLQERVGLLFASSAGALFADHGATPISNASSPRPASEYGASKVAQEQLLASLAASSRCRVLICRFSNVFGLANGQLTPRGLVASAIRASRLRQPLPVFVDPDCRRDYLYNRDAAMIALQAMSQMTTQFSEKIVCSGRTHSVAEILSLVGKVSGKRVPATYSDRPETRLQPAVLRFDEQCSADHEVRLTSLETAVHLMCRAPIGGSR